ncbi:hypothetical protein [Gordonia humi]|uniref:Uncharacterized protein n=1 Tax=Gordonia humi TaxID=686429 RepID=A0A840EUD7_9ACTN|nr:hypothetical protein [Gordonia humi]MBB4133954.1 hypothetical protein [Gordonia humi]
MDRPGAAHLALTARSATISGAVPPLVPGAAVPWPRRHPPSDKPEIAV